MRVFISTRSQDRLEVLASGLRQLDHTPLFVDGEFDSLLAWWATVRGKVNAAEVVLIDADGEEDILGFDYFLAGMCEALGMQVIVVGGAGAKDALEPVPLNLNPRNKFYLDFAEACDLYFSTARAMRGERAL